MNTTMNAIKAPLLALFIVFGVAIQCGQAKAQEGATAIFAGGCFWCVESDFERLQGVGDVVSGYTGGTLANPTYRQIKRGGTGHREAAKINYDPSVISYDQLLYAFFRSVDPTDAGGQFCDRGEHYSTAIYVATPDERAAAERAKAKAERELGQRIVTPILDASTFWDAEAYHQDYYRKSEVVLTRRGPKSKAEAYKFYRKGCGRDRRVKELWGNDAVFAG